MKRALALGLMLIATAVNAADLALSTKHTELRALASSRETSSRKTQWAPSGNFSALHTRAVFRGEIRNESRPYARESRETAARQRIWSYANLSPLRYTDPDGRGEEDLRCILDDRSGCEIFKGGSLVPLALRVRDARLAAGAARGDEARAKANARYTHLLGQFEKSAGWRYDFHQNVALPVFAASAGLAVGVGAGAGLAASAPAISYYTAAAWGSGALGKAAVIGTVGVGVASLPNFVESVRENYHDCANYSGPESLGACFNYGVDTGMVVDPAARAVVNAPSAVKALATTALDAISPQISLVGALDGIAADEAAAVRRSIPDPGKVFESVVKYQFRNKIIRENEVLRSGATVVGEIDFETEEAIVEVGQSLRGKLPQLHALAKEAVRRGKRLDIIYGPETAPGTLKRFMSSLRGKFGNRVRAFPYRPEPPRTPQ